MANRLHFADLPSDYDPGTTIAIDTETLGLNPCRDRLCLVQISRGDGDADLVQFPSEPVECPNLKRVLASPRVLKLFHFARFDLATLYNRLRVMPSPVWCTKIASKLTRTYTDRHGLRDLVKELLGVEISKQQQSSDWGAPVLSEAQLAYAASDVLHLHALKQKLEALLVREQRLELAQACFAFLPTRAKLDLEGWGGDIFAHE
jgi:ribonuclease D